MKFLMILFALQLSSLVLAQEASKEVSKACIAKMNAMKKDPFRNQGHWQNRFRDPKATCTKTGEWGECVEWSTNAIVEPCLDVMKDNTEYGCFQLLYGMRTNEPSLRSALKRCQDYGLNGKRDTASRKQCVFEARDKFNKLLAAAGCSDRADINDNNWQPGENEFSYGMKLARGGQTPQFMCGNRVVEKSSQGRWYNIEYKAKDTTYTSAWRTFRKITTYNKHQGEPNFSNPLMKQFFACNQKRCDQKSNEFMDQDLERLKMLYTNCGERSLTKEQEYWIEHVSKDLEKYKETGLPPEINWPSFESWNGGSTGGDTGGGDSSGGDNGDGDSGDNDTGGGNPPTLDPRCQVELPALLKKREAVEKKLLAIQNEYNKTIQEINALECGPELNALQCQAAKNEILEQMAQPKPAQETSSLPAVTPKPPESTADSRGKIYKSKTKQ